MGTITKAILGDNGKLKAREIDFALQFQNQWDLLAKILGIIRLIKKQDGTDLVYYTTERVGDLHIQDQEGGATTGTEYKVVPAGTYKIKLERAHKTVTAESVLEYGVDMALARTDKEFINDLQAVVQRRLYGFLENGTLKAVRPTFPGAIAASKGALINRASALQKTITEIVGFVGIMDLYNWLGEQQITVQTAFGLNYIENFMGYRLLFLLPDTIVSGKVYSTPIDNIVGYYVDPADDGLQQLGLKYTTTGETNLIGVHMDADYDHATGTTYAAMGITLFAERIDLIAAVTITAGSDSKGAVALETASNMATGSPVTGVSDGKRKSE